MTGMTVTKDTGELLIDTSKIAYGLVKSAYLTIGEKWGRYTIRASNVDPNLGSSWVQQADSPFGDQMYTITVSNARSPIVFLVGKGTLQGTVVSGSTVTFIYACASASTKAYVFDLMADNIAGGPFLKTYDTSGQITFNSLQIPLNVLTAVQAPGPPAPVSAGTYTSAYNGGRWESISGLTSTTWPVAHNIIDVAIGSVEYAAFLPWSRAYTVLLGQNYTGASAYQSSQSEGCYGRTGGISFIFGPSGATTVRNINSSDPNITLTGLPVDRFPQALVIATAAYPFPFG